MPQRVICLASKGRRAERLMPLCILPAIALFVGSAQVFAQDPVVAVRSRQAKLVTQTITHMEGDSRGMGRIVLEEGALQQCNEFRKKVYNLPAQTLPEDVLHRTETTDEEYLFDGAGYALTITTLHPVQLPDVRRWLKDAAAAVDAGGQESSARPPDCTINQVGEVKNGFLWRAGKRYSLDFQKKRAVLQPSRAIDQAPKLIEPPVVGTQFPQESIAGQRCSVTNPTQTLLGGGIESNEQCVWNDFGAVTWMTLPLGLRRTLHFGMGKKEVWEVHTESADAHPAFTADTFAIPAGFTVVER